MNLWGTNRRAIGRSGFLGVIQAQSGRYKIEALQAQLKTGLFTDI